MGVPSFYRWLVNKYPKIVSDAIEEKAEQIDRSLQNPNGLEFDNLYLDMNGIIHPCFHPDDDLFPPTTFEEVFSSMYEYIDRLVNIVRPRKLLYMAIDGVAPRAKMNQQRARRFRASKDLQLLEEMERKLRKQFEDEGKVLLPKQESQLTDSNIITPGTEFMQILSKKLQNYISLRMSENPSWGKIKVILSDATVPGEGEHKIMSFIRAQRTLPGYDPNTRHCLYGLDADLIMLALATHEIHFSILREEVLSLKTEFNPETALGYNIPKDECDKSHRPVPKKQAYQFLNVWILREYLALDLEISNPPKKFEYDLERIIDDFIFICFFAGNDFLPHMPSLEFHEGCIDLLMHVYKTEFQHLGGYLVDMQKVEDKKGGYIKLKRVERFMLSVGMYEEKIFSKRSQIRDRKLRRIKAEYEDAKKDERNDEEDGRISDIVCSSISADFDKGLRISAPAGDADTILNNTKELKQKLKDFIRKQSDLFKDGSLGTDKVNFGAPGWKQRYYMEKFSAQSSDEIEATRKDVVAKYCEGLCWVLLYYFSGVPSWTWFYPYNYGLFASDLKGLSQTNMNFQIGSPFKPFDQLMGVLPPRSSHALPVAYKGLMTDENSAIIDFYPKEFQTDVDGKRFMWQGIIKLPFIEEERLLTETRKLENKLKDHEKMRNLQTLDRLFVRCLINEWQHEIFCSRTRATSKKFEDAIMMDSTIEGMKGTIHVMPEDLIVAVDDNKGEHARKNLCLFYEIHQNCQNIPRLLEGINIPEKTVSEADIVEKVLWHENNGNRSQIRQPLILDKKWDPSPQNAPAFISKGTGSGFSVGRGKPVGELKQSTFCQDNAAKDYQWSVLKTDYGERSKVGSSSRNVYRDPRPVLNNNHSHRQANSNFWQSQTYGPSGGWRLNQASGAGSGSVWRRNYAENSGPNDQAVQLFPAGTGRADKPFLAGTGRAGKPFLAGTGRADKPFPVGMGTGRGDKPFPAGTGRGDKPFPMGTSRGRDKGWFHNSNN